MPEQTHYEVLGIESDASQGESECSVQPCPARVWYQSGLPQYAKRTRERLCRLTLIGYLRNKKKVQKSNSAEFVMSRALFVKPELTPLSLQVNLAYETLNDPETRRVRPFPPIEKVLSDSGTHRDTMQANWMTRLPIQSLMRTPTAGHPTRTRDIVTTLTMTCTIVITIITTTTITIVAVTEVPTTIRPLDSCSRAGRSAVAPSPAFTSGMSLPYPLPCNLASLIAPPSSSSLWLR